VTRPDSAPASPFKSWQWAELSALFLVVAVQLWLYQVSVVAAAAWGLLVPVLLIHVYFWMAPLVRQQRSKGGGDAQDHP
jgi:hypothetical protein